MEIKGNEEKVEAISQDQKAEDLKEILEDIPSEKRETILEHLSVMMSMQSAPESSISKKMTPEHISQFLTDSGDNMRLNHKEAGRVQWMLFVLAVLLVLFFGFVIVVFKQNPEFIEKIMYAAGGAILGGFGGFGFGRAKRN